MLFKIFLQEFHGWAYPKTSWIRTEQIASYPYCSLLCYRLVLSIDRIDLYRFLAVSGAAQEFLVKLIRLCDSGLYYLSAFGNICLKRVVDSQLFRIFRRLDYRLPSFGRKILGELHPSLHSRPSCRRPIIRYYTHPFHVSAKITIFYNKAV